MLNVEVVELMKKSIMPEAYAEIATENNFTGIMFRKKETKEKNITIPTKIK